MIRILFVLMLIANLGVAQTSITSRLDTTRTIPGKPFGMEVKVVQDKGDEIFWPMLTDSVGGLDVVNIGVNDTQTTSGNQLLITRKYQLMAFDSGVYNLPPLTFNLRSPKGNKEYLTEPLRIEVNYMAVDTTKAIKDIAPIVTVPYDWKMLLLIASGIIILIIAGFYLYKRYKNRKVEVIAEPEPAGLPHEIALAELEALKTSGLWQQGRVKEYYTELTDILRRYITRRWNLNAMELTSDEILSAGFVKIIGVSEKEKLRFILQTADLVKFAKALPLAADHETAMNYAAEFVNASVAQPEPVLKAEEKP